MTRGRTLIGEPTEGGGVGRLRRGRIGGVTGGDIGNKLGPVIPEGDIIELPL